MVKHFSLLAVLFISILLMSMNHADAADYYLGEYADGREAYLTSIRDYEVSRNGYWDHDQYDCSVKAVNKQSGEYETVSYRVFYGQMGPFMEKDGHNLYDRHTRETFLQNHPVENNLLKQIYALRKRAGKQL
ncbi:MAG: hypothetical protein J6N51_13250 [Selenomonas sp.]|nr:hypothetical protein [Selenomonas sp.]